MFEAISSYGCTKERICLFYKLPTWIIKTKFQVHPPISRKNPYTYPKEMENPPEVHRYQKFAIHDNPFKTRSSQRQQNDSN